MSGFVKFADNIPQTVTFRFDTPVEKDTEWGKKKNWGVRIGKEEMLMGTTDLLHDLLIFAGAKKNVTATICKHSIPDEKRKYWTVEIENIEYDSRNMSGPKAMTSKAPSHDLQKPEFDPKACMDYMAYLCLGMERRLPGWEKSDVRANANTIYIGTPNGCHSAPAEDDLPFD